MVLEVQKLEYHRPYEESRIQNAMLGNTQIGYVRERLQIGISERLTRLNKVHSSSKSSKEIVISQAELVMKTIFSTLNLPEGMIPLVLKKFKEIRAKIEPGKKYRTPDKLIPLTIYFVFKANNLPIREYELLGVSKITKSEFNHFKTEIHKYFPQYQQRDRQKYIIQRILEVTEHFNLGMEFFHKAKTIFIKFWSILKNTKDDVVAGVISAIVILCNRTYKISINAICKRLGIQMSTIQSQIKKKIFDHFGILGFVSLMRSSDILRLFILNVLKSEYLIISNKMVILKAPSHIKAAVKVITLPLRYEKESSYGNRGIKVGVIRTVHYYCNSIKKLQRIVQNKEREGLFKHFKGKKVTKIPFKDGKGPPLIASP
jgi:hypothetical protein